MELTPFDYGGAEVRVVQIDGQPWFVLADLCKVLGLASVGRVAARLDEGVRQAHTLQTAGGAQSMTIVSEPGMYEVVIRSDKPDAAAFRRWITSEVIPSIRKTGGYGQTRPAELTEDEIVHQALQIQSRKIEALQDHIKEIEPKADSWERFLSTVGDMSVSEAAKSLSRAGIAVGRDKLFALLDGRREDGGLAWFFRNGHGQREAYQAQVDLGRVRMKPGSYENARTGELVATITPRITAKGLDAIAKHMRQEVAA